MPPCRRQICAAARWSNSTTVNAAGRSARCVEVAVLFCGASKGPGFPYCRWSWSWSAAKSRNQLLSPTCAASSTTTSPTPLNTSNLLTPNSSPFSPLTGLRDLQPPPMRVCENFGRTSAPRLPQRVQVKFGSMSESRTASAIVQHIADAGFAHFAKGDFWRVGRHGRPRLRNAPVDRILCGVYCPRDRSGGAFGPVCLPRFGNQAVPHRLLGPRR